MQITFHHRSLHNSTMVIFLVTPIDGPRYYLQAEVLDCHLSALSILRQLVTGDHHQASVVTPFSTRRLTTPASEFAPLQVARGGALVQFKAGEQVISCSRLVALSLITEMMVVCQHPAAGRDSIHNRDLCYQGVEYRIREGDIEVGGISRAVREVLADTDSRPEAVRRREVARYWWDRVVREQPSTQPPLPRIRMWCPPSPPLDDGWDEDDLTSIWRP